MFTPTFSNTSPFMIDITPPPPPSLSHFFCLKIGDFISDTFSELLFILKLHSISAKLLQIWSRKLTNHFSAKVFFLSISVF